MFKTVQVIILLLVVGAAALGQSRGNPDRRANLGMGGGAYTVFGDLLVQDDKTPGAKPLVYEVILNNLGGVPAGRQVIHAGGRFQFLGLGPGRYELVVILE